uniref:DUF19 domain-containing protein n=1 Tax=Panagrellus redivivus TaxID=6233 RepID=A0A7E4WA44_PANRE
MQAIHTAFLLCALVGIASGGSVCYQKLTDAQTAFNTALGISGLDWFNDQSLWNLVETKYMNDVPHGFRSVCSAVKAYKKVLNFDYLRCVNVVELIRNDDGTASNVSLPQAIQYIGFINHFDFTCGAGFGIFANSPNDCIGQVFNTSAVALGQCRANLKTQLTGSTDPSMACTYIKDFTLCYQNQFKPCGPIAEYFGCEYGRVPSISTFPYCADVATNCHVVVNQHNH